MCETVDARGLPCPQPVVLTRKALQRSNVVTSIVDNEIAQRNVTRMAEKAGGSVEAEQREDGIYLRISNEAAPLAVPPASKTTAPVDGELVLLVPSEYMGRGEYPELGQVLIRSFFHTLGEVEPLPNGIIFLNSGVKLVIENSPVLEDLQALCAQGVEILACGTCLDYYGVKDKLAVGEVSNMYTIAETLLGGGRVVTL